MFELKGTSPFYLLILSVEFEVPEFSGLENMLLSEAMILALNGITGSENKGCIIEGCCWMGLNANFQLQSTIIFVLPYCHTWLTVDCRYFSFCHSKDECS
jgi:hypothetical protein